MYLKDPVSPLIAYTSFDVESAFSSSLARPKSISFTVPFSVKPREM
jgi:hypothetical protein